jgi:hypothetical protein
LGGKIISLNFDLNKIKKILKIGMILLLENLVKIVVQTKITVQTTGDCGSEPCNNGGDSGKRAEGVTFPLSNMERGQGVRRKARDGSFRLLLYIRN